MEHKLIYLARRNPKLTAEQFPQAWRDHSQFASQFGQQFRKHFKSVTQCLKLRESDLPPSFDNEYDGANLLTMVSREGLLAARYQPGTIDELKKDEERVFAGHVDPWTMGAEEYSIVDKQAEGDLIVLSFLFPREGQSEAFTAASHKAAQGLAALPAASSANRIAWNKVVDLSTAYGFGAVIEVWFPNAEEAKRAVRIPAFVAALEQTEIAEPDRGARLFTRINNPTSRIR